MKMTVDFSALKKYSRIVSRLMDVNQPVYDAVHLDFANQKATFGSRKGFGQVAMPVINLDSSVKSLFVNASGLLAVISEFSSLDFEDGVFSSGEQNTFALPSIEDSFEYPSFSGDSVSGADFNEEMIQAVKRAGVYSDESGNPAFDGVFISDGFVIGTDKLRLCEEELDVVKGVSLSLPRDAWEIIATDILGAKIRVDDIGTGLILKTDEIVLQIPSSPDLKLPPCRTEHFISQYSHSSFFKVKKSDLEKLVSFMLPFVAGTDNTRVQLNARDGFLELKSENNKQKISRKIPLISSEQEELFKEKFFWLSGQKVKMILSTLQGETLVVQLNAEKPALNFKTDEMPNRHIVYSRLSDI